MRTPLRRYTSLLGATALVLSVQDASAQGKPATHSGPPGALTPRKKASATPSVDTKALQEALRSDVPARMLDALASTKSAGPAAESIAPAIEDVLTRGATLPILVAAVEALAAMGARSSSVVLRPYVRHRSEELRRAAVRALTRLKGADAVAALKDALRGPDAIARGDAALGLGKLGAAEALPELFSALAHDVPQAAVAIGQVCMPNDCSRYAEVFLGKLPFDVVAQGFDAMLFRAPPLPEETDVKLIVRLRDFGTPDAAKYLTDVQRRWPASASQRVKDALDAAVLAGPRAGEAEK